MNALKNWTSKLSRNNTDNSSSAPVDKPEDFDILLGRGKTSFNHVGNRRFRVFIDINLQRYMDAQSRMEKTLVVNSVVEAIQDGGGRFLKQDSKTKKWYKVNAKTAREKVGHALRDGVGMQMKAVRVNPQGVPPAVAPGAVRRASGFAQARRASATELPRPGLLQRMEKDNRNARSCGALISGGDSDLQKNSMAQNAQKAAEDVRAGIFDNEEEDEEEGEKLGQGGSSELLFNDLASGKRVIPGDPISIKVKNTYVQKERKSKNVVSFPKPLISQPPKRLSGQKLSNGTTGDHCVPTRMFDGDSAELSIMSEGTTEKWFDFGSGKFSVGTVDSEVFDDNDDVYPRLVDQVNKRLTDLEFAGEKSGTGKKKGGSDLFSWKDKDKVKLSGKAMVNDVDLSEEFSTMSLDTRSKAEEDYVLKSEEFGFKSEELTRCSTIKSEEFAFKSDEFSLDANSAEFMIKVDKLSEASNRNSNELSTRNSSKAKIIQTKGLMDTVEEGAVLDNKVIARINNKELRGKDNCTDDTQKSEDSLVKSGKKSGLLDSGIS